MKRIVTFLIVGLSSSALAAGSPDNKIRLSCKYLVTMYDEAIGEFLPGEIGYVGARYAGASTNLEYVEIPGQSEMKCLSGCSNPVWKTENHELPRERLVLPDGKPDGFPFARLEITRTEKGPHVFFHSEVRHRRKDGNVVTKAEDEDKYVRGDGEINLGGMGVNESAGSDNELIERYKQTHENQYAGSHAWTEIRCLPLKSGQMSKTEIEQALTTPPQKDFSSMADYEKATEHLLDHLDMKFADLLKLARKVDPLHREAEIAKWSQAGDLAGAVREIVPILANFLKSTPEATVNDVGSVMVNQMAIGGTSKAIVALSILPLVMAEAGQ